MDKIVGLMEEFCTIHNESCRFRRDYSGRGMFGRSCVGIVCSGNPQEMLAGLCDFLYNNGIVSVKDALENICQDNMGKDTILYFPKISL